jgi:hypothetical protein
LSVLDAELNREQSNHPRGRQPSSFEQYLCPERARRRRLDRNLGRDALGHEGFNHVSDFDVAVIGYGDAALHAVRDLADVVLEAPQRPHLAFEHNHIIAQQANFGVA